MIRPFARVAAMVRGACLLIFAALSLGGCAKKSVVQPEVVDMLTLVQGGFQTRQVGRQLKTPLVFRATSASGTGVAGVPITLVIQSGGGAVDSASVKTDANGEARVKWTLGPDVAQALLATVANLAPVRVTAVGIQPSDIVVAQGNNQTGKVSLVLANSVVVRVLGGANVPMDSVNVTFQITGGGGAIAPQSAITNAFGEATVKWTLGPQAGTNTAQVRAASIDPVTITATGTP